MIRVHGKLLLDVKKRVGAGDNKMCMEKNLCTPTFSSLLLRPKCFSISICNDSYILIISLSPALTSVLPYIHESSHMCSDILFSPAPTPVLLLIYEQCSMYSNHFIITCSNCIASPHEWPMSWVLWHFILSCSDLSASPHSSAMHQVFQSFNISCSDPSALLRYCRNVRPTWVKFNSKDTKESEWCSRFWVLSPRRGLR